MKTKFLLLVLLAFFMQKGYSQCNPLFTIATNGNVVTLSNNSTPVFLAGNIITYAIDFGDGTPPVTNTFPGANTNHQYAVNGSYVIALSQSITDSVTNILNCTSTINANVNIVNAISCTMNPSLSFAPNLNNVNAIDLTTTPNITGMPLGFAYGVSVMYDYGDGSTGNSNTHVYAASGTYNVIATITVHDPNFPALVYCSQTIGVTVPFIYTNPCNVLPAFILTAVSNNVYAISNVTQPVYQNGYINSWQIDWGDGNVINANYLLNNYSHLYLNTGTYNVCITHSITDSLTNLVVCTNVSCNNATAVTNIPPYTGCDAGFTVSHDSTAPQLTYHFNGAISSTANGVINNYAWDFGDGTTGTGLFATHTYAAAGVYNVCLTISTSGACTDATCFNLSVQNLNPANLFWLAGEVFQSYNANLVPVSGSVIYLIQFEPVTQALYLVQSVAPAAGNAYGFQVNPGSYLVKAAPLPNNIQLTSYLVPTYNQDQVLWSNANTTTISNASVNNVDIVLQQGLNAGGPGFISGSVLMGANKTTVAGDPKEGLTVLLIQNANNKVYTYTTTDLNGDYTFQDIPAGTYKIYIEELGKIMTPFTVGITAVNHTFTGIDFESNTTENHPLQALSVSAALALPSLLTLFPNPVSGQLNIHLKDAQVKNVLLEIHSLEGKMVYSSQREITAQTITIDTESLPKGTYFLKASFGGRVVTEKFSKF